MAFAPFDGRCEDERVTDATLARARAGDEHAFRDLVAPHRRELHVHCYRMLGSVQDAEDVLQETLLSAWRGLGEFAERSSIRTWLYRIATNRCLNARRNGARRPPVPVPPFTPPEPTRRGEVTWLQPYPDTLLDELPDTSADPAARYDARESIALAFVVALQELTPRTACIGRPMRRARVPPRRGRRLVAYHRGIGQGRVAARPREAGSVHGRTHRGCRGRRIAE